MTSSSLLGLTSGQVLPNNAKLHHNFGASISDNARKEFHFREAIRIYPPYGVHFAVRKCDGMCVAGCSCACGGR
jgi:hypothetical protein